MFHLAWFLNFVADEWNGNWGDGGRDCTGEFYIEMAKDLERAWFDYVIIEDKLMVSTAYGGTMELDLKHGVAPKHDPVPLAMLMAQRHVAARHRAHDVDQLLPAVPAGAAVQRPSTTSPAAGSAGTSSRRRRTAPRRTSAWTSSTSTTSATTWPTSTWTWSPSCGTRGNPTPSCATTRPAMYADHTKVHTIDFEGKYYKSRGPLNTAPSPQGRPVICQAGASPPGRELRREVRRHDHRAGQRPSRR